MKKPHVILYIATSSDGYIADKNGGVSWLDEWGVDVPEELKNNYPDFFRSIDVIVMGRKTYEQMLTFGPWPNAGKHSYVFTESTEQPAHADISFVNGPVATFMQQLATTQPGCRVWLEGGAQLAQAFYEAGLIDEYIITIIPVALGEGIALPEDIWHEKGMKKIHEEVYSNGIVQRTYKRTSYASSMAS